MSELLQRRKRVGRIVIYTALFIVFVWGVKSVWPRQPTAVLSPIPEDTPKPKQSIIANLFTRKKNPDALADKVNNAINGAWNDYSVYVVDYDSDFTMGLSETETFTAASVNKVPILAALYYQVQSGTINLDQDITLQKEEIQDYGTGSLRYDEPGTVFSIKTLARLMMKQSDNTAAYILANEIIGFDKIQALVNTWGLTQTDMINNKTSNKDMAMLFHKIYRSEIANKAHTEEMLSFMTRTDFENRLPGDLPQGTIVYHKIGSDTGAIHDVGIVSNGNHTYYVGVFTNDVTDEASTEKLIAKVSRVVYDFMQ